MLAAERRAAILAAARRDGVARVADMAALLGVSDVTIRRDMEALTSEGFLEKVHGGAVLTSAPNPGAADEPTQTHADARRRALYTGHRGEESDEGPVVGILIPESLYYFKDIVDGIRSTVTAVGGRILIAVSQYTPEREADLVRGLLDSGAQGLLLAPTVPDSLLDELSGSQGAFPAPSVLVERQCMTTVLTPAVSWVRSAHEAGVLRAVGYLRDLGHERIALFARGDSPTSQVVRTGWQQAVQSLDLPADLPAIQGPDVDGWPRWTAEDVRKFSGTLRDAEVTALICHSDTDALALLQNGLTDELPVPQRLSIIAYDNELSEFTNPALTAVSPFKQHVGRLAAQTLLELLAEPDEAPTRQIDVQPALVLRGSCAAPPSA
ncbi:substrate-binding domain-containing protein [Streptomyces sp. NPDC004752]